MIEQHTYEQFFMNGKSRGLLMYYWSQLVYNENWPTLCIRSLVIPEISLTDKFFSIYLTHEARPPKHETWGIPIEKVRYGKFKRLRPENSRKLEMRRIENFEYGHHMPGVISHLAIFLKFFFVFHIFFYR